MAHSHVSYSQRTKPLVKLIERMAYSHGRWEVFSDFLALSACTISNAVDPVHREERERQYMEIIGHYTHDEVQLFPEMLAELTIAMQQCSDDGHLEDILGKAFHELELHNKYKGQFFTPQHIADFMGAVAAGERADSDEDYETMCEPCIGSGVMVLGIINAIRKKKARPVVVTGVDVDLKCVHMAYLQLSLYGIPAVVIHGNSLSCEEWSRWYTPVYVLDRWIWRERCGITSGGPGAESDELLKLATEPAYRVLRIMDKLFEEQPPAPEPPPAPKLEHDGVTLPLVPEATRTMSVTDLFD